MLVKHQAPAAPAAGFGAAASAPFAAARRPTILLSHATAVDLGRVLLYYRCMGSAIRENALSQRLVMHAQQHPALVADLNAASSSAHLPMP